MFNRNTQNLPALQASAAVAIAGGTGAAIVIVGRVSKSVQRGVMEVMLAFPSQGMPDADRRVVRDLNFEAVEGFPEAVVEWSLKDIVFNNPRNTPTFTCPPTPQDIRDACKVTDECWQSLIATYYIEGEWAKPSNSQMFKKNNDAILRRYYAAHKGGKPGEPDCIVPPDLQIQYLQREIERQLPYIEKEHPSRRSDLVPTLLLVADELLDRMPEAAFPNGALEMIRVKREGGRGSQSRRT